MTYPRFIEQKVAPLVDRVGCGWCFEWSRFLGRSQELDTVCVCAPSLSLLDGKKKSLRLLEAAWRAEADRDAASLREGRMIMEKAATRAGCRREVRMAWPMVIDVPSLPGERHQRIVAEWSIAVGQRGVVAGEYGEVFS